MIYNNNCPICNSTLIKEELNIPSSYNDVLCNSHNNHFLIKRLSSDFKLLKIKVRITDEYYKYFIKINYDDKNMYVWREKNSISTINALEKMPQSTNKVIIENTIDISNFDLNLLKNKIKTYLLLS